MDTIQKKPQEMEISLRKNGAFNLNTNIQYTDSHLSELLRTSASVTVSATFGHQA